MTTGLIITLVIISVGVVLFVTEVFPIDVVAIAMMLCLVLTGVVSIEEGLSGFSNPATITVAFMFIISQALLKTGALQYLTYRLTKVFKRDFKLGVLLMMALVAFISAFINNTPVVAVFIPVVMQIARASKISPSKLLIPLSFASVMGGMTTMLGTSTNLLVLGIARREGLDELGIFSFSGLAIMLLIPGLLYMVFLGLRILPSRESQRSLSEQVGLREYLTEIEVLGGSILVGQKIMNSSLVKDLELDILEVRRNGSRFNLPPGDFKLEKGDILKIRCKAENIIELKGQARIIPKSEMRIGDHKLEEGNSTLVEMVITSNSQMEGHTLRHADFRRRYRAAPLAIRHREEILQENLYDVPLMAGDVILAEVKSHFVAQLKSLESEREAPFAIISEEAVLDFDKAGFIKTITIVFLMIFTAGMGWIDISAAAIASVLVLVGLKQLSMKEAYEAVNWKIVFVLAGVLSLGIAMQKVGLSTLLSDHLINSFYGYGPLVLLSVIYFATSILTELMSNNATAALMAPIAIATAVGVGLSPYPFLVAVMFASSASFMTPIGYQTNTMVFGAGQYRFTDFMKVGVLLHLLFWVLSTFLIPFFFPF
jgi:di/tricarboxylate transporter